MIVDAWVEDLPAVYRALGQRIVTASDNDNLEALKELVAEVKSCDCVDVRQKMVESLGWFGLKAIVELSMFLADPNEDVADSAFHEWDSAVDESEDEHFKIAVTSEAMKILTDEGALASVATNLESADDRPSAIQAIIDIISNGNAKGIQAAKESYQFITGDEWTDVATAEHKALTIDKEEEMENEP